MAVKRINLPDAINARVNTLARARTAVVRRGVVTVAPDVNALAKVTLGGGVVDAVCLTSAVLSVGDQVVVLADTDAYWVIGEVGVGTDPAPAPVVPTIWAGTCSLPSILAGGFSSVTCNFPVGRFTAAPICTVTANNSNVIATCGGATAAKVDVIGREFQNAAAGGTLVYVHAIQAG